MKLSDYVFEAIADAGVRHVFFLPGGGAMHLVDSLGRCGGLEPVLMLHEHHVPKSSAEASQRSEARQHQAKAFTRPPTKWQSRGFARGGPKRRATTPVKPAFPGDIRGRSIASDLGPVLFIDEDSTT